MGFWEILLIGLGLSMDATAVATGIGFKQNKLVWRSVLLPALYFGLFQGIMPFLGFLLGYSARGLVMVFDHWIAFGLLAVIGGKMFFEEGKTEVKLSHRVLFLLAIATSIDALAVGISFAFLEVEVLKACVVIGIVTFVLAMTGVLLGKKLGAYAEKYLGKIGGTVLLLIGIKILVEHLFF